MTTATQVDRTLAVAIARDVLRQLGREDVPLSIGKLYSYLTEIESPDSVSGHSPGGDAIDAIQARCGVCILGGMLLSLARIKGANHVPEDPSRWMIVTLLSNAFTPAELDVIESAFECSVMNVNEFECDDHQDAHLERCAAAMNWGRSLDTRDPDEVSFRIARARAICENLIANGGQFIIPTDQ